MFKQWNIKFWEYEFLAPAWLLLLPLVLVIGWALFQKEKKQRGEWKFTGFTTDLRALSSSWVDNLRLALLLLKTSIPIFLIVALAKPYHSHSNEDIAEEYKNGIDIIIAMDISVSMLAKDFEPNRLEAAKEVAKEFVDGRRGDRIGLVVYAGEAYTACPATLDYGVLKNQIDFLGNQNIEGGTAIGTGLGTAVTRLRSDSLASKVIILLTDGSNNASEIDPMTAAELARAKNVRVYTIGVGSNGEAPTPVITPFGIRYESMPVEIDEETLQKIASTTSGKYFRAADKQGLKAIYGEIDQLEKRRMINKRYQAEPPATPMAFLNWAIVLLFVVWIIEKSLFKTYA
jgi:Ca-activated chloride channel family protein